MKTINEYMAEQMNDSEFSGAYEEIQPEMTAIRAIVEARTSRNLTQKELSVAQTKISTLERGTRNPSI